MGLAAILMQIPFQKYFEINRNYTSYTLWLQICIKQKDLVPQIRGVLFARLIMLGPN